MREFTVFLYILELTELNAERNEYQAIMEKTSPPLLTTDGHQVHIIQHR